MYACLVLLASALRPAYADDAAPFSIQSMNIQLNGPVYFFNAVFGIHLPVYIVNAIDQGFDLPLVMEIEVYREKSMWFDEKIIHIRQQYRISYHTLLDEYWVYNVNGGMRRYYPTLEKAMASLSVIIDYPGLDRNALRDDESYTARMRFGIDSAELPLPLKSSSLWKNDWDLSSDWHERELHL